MDKYQEPKKAADELPLDDPLTTQVGGEHYKSMALQPIEFIEANGLGFAEGNVVKYVCRHSLKGGIGDLLKAKHYIELLMKLKYGKGATDA